MVTYQSLIRVPAGILCRLLQLRLKNTVGKPFVKLIFA